MSLKLCSNFSLNFLYHVLYIFNYSFRSEVFGMVVALSTLARFLTLLTKKYLYHHSLFFSAQLYERILHVREKNLVS